MWIQENLKSKIFKEIQKHYGAKVFIDTTAKRVNRWIKNKTMNKFKDVVQDCEPTNEELCGLSLINTIYFQGNWKNKFEKELTAERPFIINKKEKVEVPIMYMTDYFNYMETETMQMLEMPYKGEELSMLVLLPKDFSRKSKEREAYEKNSITNTKKPLEKADLISLEKALTEKNLKKWRKALSGTKIGVYFPKFTFKKNYKLSKTLKQHMPLAFDKKKADFFKFAVNIKKRDGIYI